MWRLSDRLPSRVALDGVDHHDCVLILRHQSVLSHARNIPPSAVAGLQWHSARVRKASSQPSYYSLLDQSALTSRDILTKYFFRLLPMLTMEPILVCFTIYMIFPYSRDLTRVFFTAYPLRPPSFTSGTPKAAALPFWASSLVVSPRP